MKRSIGETENIASMVMLLSQRHIDSKIRSSNRVFACKTCNRQFPSFQALGGHRASHKKPKLMGGDQQQDDQAALLSLKPKIHECSICGLEFPIGQALGGHMRRHRASMTKSFSPPPPVLKQLPVLKRSNSRRVLCLDLNLSPLENDLGFSVANCFKEEFTSPVVHCFI